MKIEPRASNVISTIDDHRISTYQLLIVALCLVFNMIDGFDITAMAVTAHQIDEEMHLGADRLGLVFSFSLAGMMLGAAFLASFSDIVGRRSIVIASLLLVGLTVLLTANATSLTGLLALRFPIRTRRWRHVGERCHTGCGVQPGEVQSAVRYRRYGRLSPRRHNDRACCEPAGA